MRLRLIERSETPDFLLVSSFQGWSTFQSASNTATTFHRTKTNTSIFILAQRYNRRRSTPQLMNCTNIYTADTSIFILTQRYQEIFAPKPMTPSTPAPKPMTPSTPAPKPMTPSSYLLRDTRRFSYYDDPHRRRSALELMNCTGADGHIFTSDTYLYQNQ